LVSSPIMVEVCPGRCFPLFGEHLFLGFYIVTKR
jgi:hypothetical protein